MPQRRHERRFRLLSAALVAACLLASTGFFSPTGVLAANPTPVAEWTFDEGTGGTAYDSVGNLDGALSSGATWITSGAPQGSGAIAFDGTANGLVTIASGAALQSADITVVVWVRGSDVDFSTQHTIVRKGFYGCEAGGSWEIDQTAFDALATVRITSGQTTGFSANPHDQSWNGTWRKVFFVWDSAGLMRVWIDGYKSSSDFGQPTSIEYGPTDRVDDALVLGGPGADCPYRQPYHGAIDDLQVFGSALSDAQILALTPVFSTTTTASALQDGQPDPATTIYNDRPMSLRAIISPPPGVNGDTDWYLSKDGAPEELAGTTQIPPGATGATWLNKAAGSLDPGHYAVRAVWKGTPNWPTSSSSVATFEVVKRPVVLEVAASPTTDVPGGASTLTARVRVDNPPTTYVIPGSIDFYETTGGANDLVGSAALSFVGGPTWNRAQLSLSNLGSGTHTYEARYSGTSTLGSASAITTVEIGRQMSLPALSIDPNPVLNTGHATATVYIGTSRNAPDDSGAALPPATGTVTVKRASNDAVLGSAIVNGSGPYQIALPIFPTGTVGIYAEYSGDSNFQGSVGDTVVLAVQSDIVQATGVGVGYSTFYPIKDGYRDTVSIKGIRQEPASVAVRIYNSSNKPVRAFALASGTGAYSILWNGRNSAGTLLASGPYRVVQTLTDAAGTKLVVTKSVTLSRKKLYYYTKTISKLAKYASSVGTASGGKVTVYSDGSMRLYGGMGWAGVGWQLALPSAPVYKSLSMGVYGYSGAPLGQMGAQNFTFCAYSSTWNTGCFDRWTSLKSSKAWASRSISPTTNRYGRTVRVAVSQTYGSSRVYRVRVIVTYGLLK